VLARLVAGFLQAAAGVAVGVWWRARHPVVGPGDEAAQFIHGFAHFLYFLVATPWGWLALWLFVEGILRVLAAAMQQPLGTAPVTIARAAWGVRPRKKLPDDYVSKSGDALVILSARDYDWHALTTVDVDGALYAVAREAGPPDRPYRYRLTPIAHDHVVRAVTRYSVSAPAESSRTGRPPRR
jgi:hypothetical protein